MIHLVLLFFFPLSNHVVLLNSRMSFKKDNLNKDVFKISHTKKKKQKYVQEKKIF